LKKRKYLILGLFIFILHGQSSAAEMGLKSFLKMENKIYLAPVGKIEEWILDTLEDHLEKTFRCQVEIGEGLELPEEAYDSRRNQHFSPIILEKLRQAIKPTKTQKILAISGVDLYVEGLNFVFGEAELGGHFAIISLARLHQSFYGFPENKSLFLERAKKEAVHELGHTFGLRHCPDSECVMHFSNSLRDTDRKQTSFCSRCQELLKKSRARR
jgi:archaemetzincin